MTLITVNPNRTRHETSLPALVDQLRDVAMRCERWHELARQPHANRTKIDA
jgi:hypothetical protein